MLNLGELIESTLQLKDVFSPLKRELEGVHCLLEFFQVLVCVGEKVVDSGELLIHLEVPPVESLFEAFHFFNESEELALVVFNLSLLSLKLCSTRVESHFLLIFKRLELLYKIFELLFRHVELLSFKFNASQFPFGSFLDFNF